MLLAIQTPANNERGPTYSEQLLTTMHQVNGERLPVTLIFGSHNHKTNAVALYCQCDDSLQHVFRDQLLAHYHDCHLSELSETDLDCPEGSVPFIRELRLRPDVFPIRRHPQFLDETNRTTADPLTAILATIASANRPGLRAKIEIETIPATAWRQRHARNVIERLAFPFFRSHRCFARFYAQAACSRFVVVRSLARVLGYFAATPDSLPRADPLSTSASRAHEREDDLQSATVKLNGHLFETRIRLVVYAPKTDAPLARQMLRQLAAAFGPFKGLAAFRSISPIFQRAFLLSSEELATLWHPPLLTVKTPKMDTTASRRLEAPADVPLTKRERGLAALGRVHFRDQADVFGIRYEDRFRHLAIIGKTGMGKSTLLQNLIVSDMRHGKGVGLIDPHGDLADTVVALVPKCRTNDVVLFDAGDRAYPLAFNPLDVASPEQRPGIASGVVSAFKKLYTDSWGPRLEYILRNSLLALLEAPDTSLVSLMQLLSDPAYRQGIIRQVRDPAVRLFWEKEFMAWRDRYRTEAIAPIQNKIGQFVTHPILRGLIGQPKSSLDLRGIMDEGKILIVNLSKGEIGEDVSTLLGSLLVTSLQMAAMSRADQLEGDRQPFFAYVDEFQNFATESFATILSEARKYCLALTIANQYLAQMDEGTLDAVFGNVGSLLTFQVGPQDAAVLADQLAGDVEPEDLITLPRYTAYLRLLIDGMPSRPFSMQTLPPPAIHPQTQRPQRVRAVSRRRYARPVEEVERIIGTAFAAV